MGGAVHASSPPSRSNWHQAEIFLGVCGSVVLVGKMLWTLCGSVMLCGGGFSSVNSLL